VQLSSTLRIDGEGKNKAIACISCGHDLCPADANWKSHAALDERPAEAFGSPYTTGAKVLIRSFVCPGCGTLLDTELALPGDPFLEDRLFD